MKRFFLAPFFALMLLLPACSTTSVVPQTPREALAAAEITFTNILKEADAQIKAGMISPAEVEKLRPFAIAVANALDAAQIAIATGQPAENALAAVNDALHALQIELAKPKG